MSAIFKSNPGVEEESGPVPRRWTREEYNRITDLGFFDGQRLELIEGRILQISPQRAPHSMGIEYVDDFLRAAFGKGFRIRTQLPFMAAGQSEPEPDFAVIRGSKKRGAVTHPSSAVLIVEISDTTLEYDRRKARIYAQSGVPEYWIVNLIGRSLEVYRKPITARTRAADSAYESAQILKDNDRIAPLAAPKCEITVAELLP